MPTKYAVMVPAPWTDEQVRWLKLRQNYPLNHPYTCNKCGNTFEVTNNGFLCSCGETQTWCLELCLHTGRELEDPKSETSQVVERYLNWKPPEL